MGKLGEHTKCPLCDGEMTLRIDRNEKDEPVWKGWVCGNIKCNHRNEQSFPHSEGVYGGETLSDVSEKVPKNSK
jgi:hypothetical protein